MKTFFKKTATLFFSALVIAGAGWLLWQWINPWFDNLRNRDNNEIIAFHDHFESDPAIPNIVLEGQRLRDIVPPLIHNGMAFFPVDFIRAHIDPFMFWDTGAQTLFVTTRSEMLAFRPGEVRTVGGLVYVPADTVMGLYPFTVIQHGGGNGRPYTPNHGGGYVPCPRALPRRCKRAHHHNIGFGCAGYVIL
jgi:hypothetical protein